MKHKFVEFMPKDIEDKVLYISIEFDVAKHKCPCGCGDIIVTSFSPARWRLIYDGESVSLEPSIGNWSHECRSHYYIKNDKIVWLSSITKEIDTSVSERDKHALKKHYQEDKLRSKVMTIVKKIFTSKRNTENRRTR